MPAVITIQEPCHWLGIAEVHSTLATALIIPDMAHEETSIGMSKPLQPI